MKKKREIELLDARAQKIVFPSACDQFSRYRTDLRNIIDENCGYGIAKTLEYDEYEHLFNVQIQIGGQLLAKIERDNDDPADRANVELTVYVTIDPREPLAPQIDKINAAKEALQSRHAFMSILFSKLREGYKMAKLGADQPL